MKKKLYSLLALLLFTLGSATAYADAAEDWAGKGISAVSAATTPKAGKFYIMRANGSNDGNKIVCESDGKLAWSTTTSETTADGLTSVFKGTTYMSSVIKLVANGDGYNIQFQSGNYLQTLSESVQATTGSASTEIFTITEISGASNYYVLQGSTAVSWTSWDSSTGTSALYLDGSSSNPVGWHDASTSASGNGSYQFFEVTLADMIDVTYNYYIDSKSSDNLYKTSTGYTLLNSTLDTPSAPDQFTSYNSATATQGGNTLEMGSTITSSDAITMDVICDPNLPFKITTNDSNPNYYVFGIHNSDWGTFTIGEETWVIKCDGTDLSKEHIAYVSNKAFGDEYLWYIKGDLINGFQFYSKNSGTNFLTMPTDASSESICTMGSDATTGSFKLYANEYDNTAFTLKISTYTNYVNKNGILGGYNKADGGGAIHMLAASSFPISYYNQNFSSCQGVPSGVLGGFTTAGYEASTTALSNATTAISTLTEDPLNAEATASLIAANTTLESNKIAIPTSFDGKYYRLINYKNGQILTPKDDYSALTSVASDETIGSIVKFALADGSTTQYVLSVNGAVFGKVAYDQGGYLNSSAGDAAFEMANTGALFTFHDVSTAPSTDYGSYSGYRYLHLANSGTTSAPQGGNIVGYTNSTSETASFWYLAPVETVDITLTTIDDASYATTCLPFGVSSVSGATAYIGAYNDDETEIDATATDGTIPANEGVILVGEKDATAATLTIGTGSAVTGNVLSGTCVPITNDSYLTFGRIKGQESTAIEPGFYLYTGTTIPANKAYLVKTAAETIRLNFGDATTGIDAATLVNGEQNNAPVYDLSGRRVASPVKGGIYLQGGKKFIK